MPNRSMDGNKSCHYRRTSTVKSKGSKASCTTWKDSSRKSKVATRNTSSCIFFHTGVMLWVGTTGGMAETPRLGTSLTSTQRKWRNNKSSSTYTNAAVRLTPWFTSSKNICPKWPTSTIRISPLLPNKI